MGRLWNRGTRAKLRSAPKAGPWGLRGALGATFALATACAGPAEPTTTELPLPPVPLVDTAAGTPEALCTGAEIRRWELVDAGGEALATTQGVCRPSESEGAPGPYVAVSQLIAGDRPRYELRIWLDASGQPRAAQLREPSSTRYYHWSEARLVETHLGDVRSQSEPPEAPPTWIVPSHALFVRELMLRLGVGHVDGQLHHRTFIPDRNRFAVVDLEPSRADDADHGELPLGPGRFVLTDADKDLRDLRLERFVDQAGQAVYRSVEPPAALEELLPETPKARYRLAADLEARELSIEGEAGAPRLGAELVSSPASAAGPRPGILFISGAGPQDRYGIVPGGDVDVGSHEIHDGLARAGFAVLRYDDRGVGDSAIGDDVTPGFEALVDDARRALVALAAQPEVDPEQLFVMGHGEGALIATLIAQERHATPRGRRRVAGAILLAAPGRNIRELVYDEIRRSLSGRDEFTVNAAVEQAKRVHEAALADKDLPANAEPLREWMQEIFAIDPALELSRLRVPVLALQGEKDFQVDRERDFGPVSAALAKTPGSSVAQEIPGVDHLFKPEPGRSHPGHYHDLARHVDDAVVQRIRDWLAAQTR